MTLYNCETKLRSEVIENCDDNDFIIVGEKEMQNYDNVEHLVAFLIDDNIYNVCNSGSHGDALNCLTEKYGNENATVICLGQGNGWEIRNKINSIKSLYTLKEFLLNIENRFDEESSIIIDEINPYIEVKRYKKADYKHLLDQVDYAIYRAEEEEKDRLVNEIANQIQERKKHSFLESAKRFLCGK